MERQCDFCKQANVEIVSADSPWTVKHWQCPVCDSTYNLEAFPED